MKRRVTAGHVRRKSSSNHGYVGRANFGKRVWALRPSTLIFDINKKDEPTQTEESEKLMGPFIVVRVVEYIQQIIEWVQEMFNMYCDELLYRYDCSKALLHLLGNALWNCRTPFRSSLTCLLITEFTGHSRGSESYHVCTGKNAIT